jgi:hypothetical protein
MYMLSGSELIDTENISLPSQNMKFGGEWISVEKLWIQNTRIIHDVWRLLILSNEEKGMIMKILKKRWFIWKFWKKGGSREKGVGGN